MELVRPAADRRLPLVHHHHDVGVLAAIFTLGIGAICGGRWQDRVGPRTVALAGILLWALGNVLAGVLTPHFGAWGLY